MTEYLYYPGCSMEGVGRAYASSLGAVATELGLDLREIDDWNCCGAFEMFALSRVQAHALIGRNLALAERQANGSRTVLAACSLCFLNLAKTDFELREDPALRGQINDALGAGGLRYDPGSLQVRHLFEILVRDIGFDEIARHVIRPLEGLRVAPYLGCLVTRPDADGRWDAHEHPVAFDRLLGSLGAEVVDFPLRTACCGGHMSQISPDTGFELIRRLLDAATRLEADMLVTVCPMCQMNVDVYQAELNRHFGTDYKMPILFFTQLMGLAFGEAPANLGLGLELVSARPALGKIGVHVEPAAEEAGPARPHRPKRPSGLPMPKMPEPPVGLSR